MTECTHGKVYVSMVVTLTDEYCPETHEWSGLGLTEEVHTLVSAECVDCEADMLEWAKKEFPTLPVKEASK